MNRTCRRASPLTFLLLFGFLPLPENERPRLMKRALFLVLVGYLLIVVASAKAQQASWLEPPDAMLQKAIDDGFAQQKMPKEAKYHKYVDSIKAHTDYRVEVRSPLFCALNLGKVAHDRLHAKPSLQAVKQVCLRRVSVYLIHYSQSLNANWPCVFQKGEVTLQPKTNVPDDSPAVTSYLSRWSGELVGYLYVNIYHFEFPDSLQDGASLVYADETGQHHSLQYDFAVFAKDVSNR